MNINPLLKLAVKLLSSKWSAQGSVRVISWDEYAKKEHQPGYETYQEFLHCRNIFFHPSPDCILVDYDFQDDELWDKPEELEKFHKDLDLLWRGMALQGEPLHDIDGSGNGLHYGIFIYSK